MKHQTDNRSWYDLAVETEDRLHLTELENDTYNEYSPDDFYDIAVGLDDNLGLEAIPRQRRSILSFLFSVRFYFNWKR